MTCFFMDRFGSRMTPRFLAESEQGMLWEPRVTESGNGGRFQGRRKWKQKSFCFVVVNFKLIFGHPCFHVVCVFEFFGEVGHFTKRSGFLELCNIRKKLMIYRVVSYDIGEKCDVQDEENGPEYWALRHTVLELWWWWKRVIDRSGLISVWEIWLKPLEWSRLNAKNRLQAGEKDLVVNSIKSCRKIHKKRKRKKEKKRKKEEKKRKRNVVIVHSGDNVVYNT